MTHAFHTFCGAVAVVLCASVVSAETPEAPPSNFVSTEPTRLFAILREALELRGSWESIHAAEALATLNDPKPVLAAFRDQTETTTAGYRIGVWRVLARVEESAARRQEYVERIRQVLRSPNAPDRIHALEALAKLGTPIADDAEREIVVAMARSADEPGSPFALWRLAQAGEVPDTVERLTARLASKDEVIRLRSAYVLARLRPWPETTRTALTAALASEPPESIARPFLVCAAGGDGVLELARTATQPAARYTAAMELAGQDSAAARRVLRSLLDDADADVRIAAAFSLLRLDRGDGSRHVPASER